jgi:hypothetical protein
VKDLEAEIMMDDSKQSIRKTVIEVKAMIADTESTIAAGGQVDLVGEVKKLQKVVLDIAEEQMFRNLSVVLTQARRSSDSANNERTLGDASAPNRGNFPGTGQGGTQYFASGTSCSSAAHSRSGPGQKAPASVRSPPPAATSRGNRGTPSSRPTPLTTPHRPAVPSLSPPLDGSATISLFTPLTPELREQLAENRSDGSDVPEQQPRMLASTPSSSSNERTRTPEGKGFRATRPLP